MEVAILGKKAFLVTDEGIGETGLVDQVTDRLGDLLVGVFSDVPQESGMEVVVNGAEAALAAGADVPAVVGTTICGVCGRHRVRSYFRGSGDGPATGSEGHLI